VYKDHITSDIIAAVVTGESSVFVHNHMWSHSWTRFFFFTPFMSRL